MTGNNNAFVVAVHSCNSPQNGLGFLGRLFARRSCVGRGPDGLSVPWRRTPTGHGSARDSLCVFSPVCCSGTVGPQRAQVTSSVHLVPVNSPYLLSMSIRWYFLKFIPLGIPVTPISSALPFPQFTAQPQPIWGFLKKRFYLFIHERHTERGRDMGRSRLHAGSPMWDLILGLQGSSTTPWLRLNH